MRTFTRSELVDWFKKNMDWHQDTSEVMADYVFKARTPGAKDIKKRKRKFKYLDHSGKEISGRAHKRVLDGGPTPHTFRAFKIKV